MRSLTFMIKISNTMQWKWWKKCNMLLKLYVRWYGKNKLTHCCIVEERKNYRWRKCRKSKETRSITTKKYQNKLSRNAKLLLGVAYILQYCNAKHGTRYSNWVANRTADKLAKDVVQKPSIVASSCGFETTWKKLSSWEIGGGVGGRVARIWWRPILYIKSTTSCSSAQANRNSRTNPQHVQKCCTACCATCCNIKSTTDWSSGICTWSTHILHPTVSCWLALLCD